MEPTQQHNIHQEESIDIKKYLFKFLANWHWFAISLSIAFTIAYLINRYSEPTYTISSSVIIGNNEAEMGSINALISELGMNRRKLRTEVVNEVSILKSYSLARKTIEELDFEITYVSVGRREIAENKMYHNCPFIVIPDSNYIQKNNYPIYVKILNEKEYLLEINDNYDIKEKVSFSTPFIHKDFKFKIFLRHPELFKYNSSLSNKYYFYFNDINTLTKQYRGKLGVEPNDERGSILTLKISGFVPEKMAAYLNRISEVYIQSDLNEKNRQAQNTINFIDSQLSIILDSLNKTEYKLQKFRSDNQIFDLSQKGNMLIEELNGLQKKNLELEINNRYYDYIEKYLRLKEGKESIVNPSSLNVKNTALEGLVQIYNASLFKINRIQTYTNEATSGTVLLEQELDLIRKSLFEQVQVGKTLNEINNAELNQEIIKIETEINLLPLNERNLVNIEREFKLNNNLYTFLLEKQAEASITKASNVSSNKILDVAIPENAGRLSPNRSKNYMLALIIGLGFPAAFLILLEFFNTKIEDKKDIEKHTKIPIIGTIGHNDTRSEIPVFLNPKSSIAESFRSLRTNLQFFLREENQKTIMITSTISGEGKTFAAINLATIIAMMDKKVLLLGLDLRKPSLHKIFNLQNETGISTYLSNQSTWNETIKKSPIENLYIATSGPIPPNPAELIETKQMKAFFTSAEKEFDYVILDTPPIALVTDALLLSQHSSINIFLIRQRYTHKRVFELINKLEQYRHIKNINLLINDLKIPKYYGYNYGYNYGYGYGYGKH